MNDVNQKILDAVIAKAKNSFPDSIELIGIYGSVATGDAYAKSDLDLLIVTQNEEGRKLSTGFILEDIGVGYDIYCMNWDALRYDAECHHAYLARLMDSQIVYVKTPDSYAKLCDLREQAKLLLQSDNRLERVTQLLEKAKVCFANAYLDDTIGKVRLDAYGVIYHLLDAVMIYHGKYFKLGIKRTFEELSALPLDEEFPRTIQAIAASENAGQIRDLLKTLLFYTEAHMSREVPKELPSPNLAGTYEEMYSNWRNKVADAADRDDVFASFMNLCSLQWMLTEIASAVEIGDYDILNDYDPHSLTRNLELYDSCLQRYEDVYHAAHIQAKRFSNVDEFITDYLK